MSANVPVDSIEHYRKRNYSMLHGKFILLVLICSIVPLLAVGWTIHVKYFDLSSFLIIENLNTHVQLHRKAIDSFLRDRTHDLELMALTHSIDFLRDQRNLETVFKALNRYGNFYEDLSIFNEQGFHLAYVGPFDLMKNDYSQTFWFREVQVRGSYVSDVFLGYRKMPHFIIAILRSEGERRWVIRATIDAERFLSIVESVRIGKTGAVYLLDQEGRYQTRPPFGGRIMEQASLQLQYLSAETGGQILQMDGETEDEPPKRLVVAHTWLNEPRWALVVQQDYDEAFDEVKDVSIATLLFIHLSVLGIVLLTVATVRYMMQAVKKHDSELFSLNEQLLQSSKLASLGELAAGVAHEINNPLAVILSESQVVRDCSEDVPVLAESFKEELLGSLSQIEAQVRRCKTITGNLLRLARCDNDTVRPLDINLCIAESVKLLEKRAASSGIRLEMDLGEDLPLLKSECSQLQQVILNLVNNAIDAHEGKPYGLVQITSRRDERRPGIELIITDTGEGISPEHLGRIFDPFFTTKAVGAGTGLGLSISYRIVSHLGGSIEVESKVGSGTRFSVFLPSGSFQSLEGGDYGGSAQSPVSR